MKFTWDEARSVGNRQKHGIAFADVPTMVEHPMVTFLDRKKENGEDRWVGIGWLSDVLAVVVYTEPDDETIRIVSARKANRHEQGIYVEAQTHYRSLVGGVSISETTSLSMPS